jgi:hypothetical protein
MNSTLLRSTQVSITFSIQVRTDREADLLPFVFLLLLPLLCVWQVKRKVYQLMTELGWLVMDLTDLLIFIGKVIAITFTAFAYGLGVKL